MKPFALALIAGSLIASHALAGDFGARTLAPSLAPSLRPPSTSTQLRPSISRPSLLSEYGVPSTTGSSLPSQQPTTTYSPPSSASRTARWEAPLDSAYAPTARDDSAYPRAAAGVDDALDYRARASARVNEDLGLQPGSRVDGVGLLPRVRVEGDPLPPGSPVDGAGLLPRLRVDELQHAGMATGRRARLGAPGRGPRPAAEIGPAHDEDGQGARSRADYKGRERSPREPTGQGQGMAKGKGRQAGLLGTCGPDVHLGSPSLGGRSCAGPRFRGRDRLGLYAQRGEDGGHDGPDLGRRLLKGETAPGAFKTSAGR